MAETNDSTKDNDNRPSVKLKVAEAKNRDVIRGKIRLDNHSMKKIGVSTGEIVEISGTKITAAVAWPAYPEDLKKSIIRMDSVIRQNAGVSLSENVLCKSIIPSKLEDSNNKNLLEDILGNLMKELGARNIPIN